MDQSSVWVREKKKRKPTVIEIFISGVKQPMLQHWFPERCQIPGSHGLYGRHSSNRKYLR